MAAQFWDKLSIAAASLCVIPGIVTTVYSGVPDDLGWALPIALLVFTAILAAPQLVMLAFVRAAQSQALRILSLLVSSVMVIAYALFVPTVDLASDAQAGLSFPFFQFYLAGAAVIAGGPVSWLYHRFFDGGADS